MKIGIVLYPTYGGSGVIATELGKALSERGNEVHFISYSQPVRLDFFNNRIFYHEVDVSDYPLFEYPPYELALASKIVEVVKYEKINLLHVHYAIPHAYASCVAKQILKEENKEIPVVTTLHGTDITLVGKHPNYAPAVEFSINHSDVVTTVSESLKKDTLKQFKINKKVQVIPNFIDNALYKFNFNVDVIKKSFSPKGDFIITHISNFRKVKRVEDVVRVFNKLSKKVEAKLLMVGDGPTRESAEMLVRKFNLSNSVKFLGKSKKVEQVLSISDLFLLPSETESFGLVALEAMAAGVPVVSSNSGGLPEVNINKKTGFISDVGDVNTMADKALIILKNKEFYSQNALNQAKKFDIEKILPLYLRLYDSLI